MNITSSFKNCFMNHNYTSVLTIYLHPFVSGGGFGEAEDKKFSF